MLKIEKKIISSLFFINIFVWSYIFMQWTDLVGHLNLSAVFTHRVIKSELIRLMFWSNFVLVLNRTSLWFRRLYSLYSPLLRISNLRDCWSIMLFYVSIETVVLTGWTVNVEQLVKWKLAGEAEVLSSKNLHHCGFIKSSRVKNIELFRWCFSKDGVNGRKGKGLLAKFEREMNMRKEQVTDGNWVKQEEVQVSKERKEHCSIEVSLWQGQCEWEGRNRSRGAESGENNKPWSTFIMHEYLYAVFKL
jgi:hypothetical protein